MGMPPPGMPPPNFSMPPPGFQGSSSTPSAGGDGQELWVENKSADGKVFLSECCTGSCVLNQPGNHRIDEACCSETASESELVPEKETRQNMAEYLYCLVDVLLQRAHQGVCVEQTRERQDHHSERGGADGGSAGAAAEPAGAAKSAAYRAAASDPAARHKPAEWYDHRIAGSSGAGCVMLRWRVKPFCFTFAWDPGLGVGGTLPSPLLFTIFPLNRESSNQQQSYQISGFLNELLAFNSYNFHPVVAEIISLLNSESSRLAQFRIDTCKLRLT